MNLKEIESAQLLSDYAYMRDVERRFELLSRLEQIDNLKCCGNCSLHGADGVVTDTECYHIGDNEPESYCNQYQSDGMKREQRMIK